jgi:hypothetical protein
VDPLWSTSYTSIDDELIRWYFYNTLQKRGAHIVSRTPEPYSSPHAATYGGRLTVFELPQTVGPDQHELSLDRHSYQQILAQVRLPHQLPDFLSCGFVTERLYRCGIQGRHIRFLDIPHLPGDPNRLARDSDALSVLWTLLAETSYNVEVARPEWRLMPPLTYERGAGLDLGEVGVQMAYMMRRICGFAE